MWNTIRANVTNDLRLIQQQTKFDTLYITGISLGGGLSGISFIDIRVENIFKTISVVTFGSPRVGNKNWANFFDTVTNGKALRYIVKGDPIVVLPHCLTLLCNYKHYGIQIVCTEEDSKCVQNDDVPETFFGKILKSTTGIDSDIKKMRSIMDHVDGYPKIYNFTRILKQ